MVVASYDGKRGEGLSSISLMDGKISATRRILRQTTNRSTDC